MMTSIESLSSRNATISGFFAKPFKDLPCIFSSAMFLVKTIADVRRK